MCGKSLMCILCLDKFSPVQFKFSDVTVTPGKVQMNGRVGWKMNMTTFASGFEKAPLDMSAAAQTSVFRGSPACPPVTLLSWHNS